MSDDWHSGHYDHADDDMLARQQRTTRWFIAFVSLLVIVMLAAIPVLRIIELNRTSDPAAAAHEARIYVARQFADAALEHRSTRLAMQWALPSLHDSVDDIVGFLQTRDAATLRNTTVSVRPVSCLPPLLASTECFQAALQTAGQPDVIQMRYTVGIVSGKATVVDVLRLGISARLSLPGIRLVPLMVQ